MKHVKHNIDFLLVSTCINAYVCMLRRLVRVVTFLLGNVKVRVRYDTSASAGTSKRYDWCGPAKPTCFQPYQS